MRKLDSIDVENIQTGVDSRLADMHMSDAAKNVILHRIKTDSAEITLYNSKKKIDFKKVAVAVIAACLCFLISVPVLGATVPSYNKIIYNYSPEFARFLMPTKFDGVLDPLDLDDRIISPALENGIECKLISAVCDKENLLMEFTLQDKTSDRLVAGSFAFGISILGNKISNLSWSEYYDTESKTLTVYIMCYNTVPGEHIAYDLTISNIDTDDPLENWISECDVEILDYESIQPMTEAGGFTITDFRFSALSFKFNGTGELTGDIVYSVQIFMLSGESKKYGGTIFYYPSSEQSEPQFGVGGYYEESYDAAGQLISRTEGVTFSPWGDIIDGLLFQEVFFNSPLDYKNISRVEFSIVDAGPPIVIEFSNDDSPAT